MIGALKGEFRKLLTVRSTYIIVIISLVLVGLFAGFGDGFRGTTAALQRPDALMNESSNAIVFVGLIFAFAGLLLMGHEYRYNTIMYTLTINNRRWKVLLAKFFAISVFAAVTSLIVVFFSPLCTIVGAHLHGHHIGPQHFDYWQTIWRCVFEGWGYAMYAFILSVILRNQIGSIITFLVIPLIGENLIVHIFKHSDKFLPFTMLQRVVSPGDMGEHVTVAHAATVAVIYVVIGLVVSTVLFARRDAN